MRVIFKTKNNDLESFLAVQRYQRIWQVNQKTILDSFKLHSGLDFNHRPLTIYVDRIDGSGHSGDIGMPMVLSFRDDQAMYDDSRLAAFLLHELAHRLLISNGIRSVRKDYGYQRNFLAHKRIDLFLYDVWVDVVGRSVASQELIREFDTTKAIFDAWQWALSKSYEERQAELAKLRKHRDAKKLRDHIK